MEKKYINIWNKTAFDFYPREVVEKYLKENNIPSYEVKYGTTLSMLKIIEGIAKSNNDKKMLKIVKGNINDYEKASKIWAANPIID